MPEAQYYDMQLITHSSKSLAMETKKNMHKLTTPVKENIHAILPQIYCFVVTADSNRDSQMGVTLPLVDCGHLQRLYRISKRKKAYMYIWSSLYNFYHSLPSSSVNIW